MSARPVVMNRARAEEIAATFMRPELRDTLPRAYAAFLCANAIMEAVAESREECAAMLSEAAERVGRGRNSVDQHVAAVLEDKASAIRSRNEQPAAAKDSQ